VMMFRLTAYIVVFTVLSSLSLADDPCRFEVNGKGVIDISSLAKKDKTAAFPDEAPAAGSNYRYSYNPCKPFSEGETCIDVAVCQVSFDAKFTFILGKQDSAKWDAGVGATNPMLSYSYKEKNVQIEMNCAQDKTTPELEALGEGPQNFYKFKLTSKCACYNGCKSGGGGGDGSGSGIPGGAVFLIILLVLLVVYFVGFALFYRIREQKTGADLIAHRTFWVSLPVYAKGGVMCIVHKVTGKGGQYESV